LRTARCVFPEMQSLCPERRCISQRWNGDLSPTSKKSGLQTIVAQESCQLAGPYSRRVQGLLCSSARGRGLTADRLLNSSSAVFHGQPELSRGQRRQVFDQKVSRLAVRRSPANVCEISSCRLQSAAHIRERTYKNSHQVFGRSTHVPGPYHTIDGSAIDSSIAGRHRPGEGQAFRRNSSALPIVTRPTKESGLRSVQNRSRFLANSSADIEAWHQNSCGLASFGQCKLSKSAIHAEDSGSFMLCCQ